jgi:hypothetical protein
MSIKIVTAESLAADKVANGLTRNAHVILGNGRDNVKNEPRYAPIKFMSNGNEVEFDSIPYKVTSKAWKNSEGQFNLYRDMKVVKDRLENAGNAPSPTDLAAYYAYLFIDVARQADELADHSAEIYNVISRPDAPEVTKLRDIIPYVGKEKKITGASDSVPLIEANEAQTADITLYFKAFGWKDSIKNLVFNPFDSIARVTEAAAKILVDSRNNDVIGYLVGLTYPALQSQVADTTGATRDLKVYNTFVNAIGTISKLKHPLTGRLLSNMGVFAGKLKVLAHPKDAWDFSRILGGQLVGASGVAQNVSALPIASIIPYGGGIMDGLIWGKETLSLPGVTQGYAYLFLPNDLGGFVLDKVDLTLETGQGSVLELSAEERAWYRVNGLFHDWFVGGAKDNTNSGLGCVVKITLPA